MIVWEIATKKEVANCSFPQWVQALSFSHDGKMLAVGIGCPYSSNPELEGLKKKPGEIRIYDTEKFQETTKISESDGVHFVRFSPDGEWLASASSKFHEPGQSHAPGAVKLWKVGTWKEATNIPDLSDVRPGIAFHPQKNQLAVADMGPRGGDPGKLIFFDVATQKSTGHFTVQVGARFFLEYCPNGKLIALLVPNGRTVALWNPETGKDDTPLALTNSLTQTHPIAAFSPDSKFLAGTEDMSDYKARTRAAWIKIWDLQKQKQHAQWNWDTKWVQVTCLAFTPDSRSLAAGASDGTIKIFRVPD